MVKYWCAAIKYARITSLEALLCEKRSNGPNVTNDDNNNIGVKIEADDRNT